MANNNPNHLEWILELSRATTLGEVQKLWLQMMMSKELYEALHGQSIAETEISNAFKRLEQEKATQRASTAPKKSKQGFRPCHWGTPRNQNESEVFCVARHLILEAMLEYYETPAFEGERLKILGWIKKQRIKPGKRCSNLCEQELSLVQSAIAMCEDGTGLVKLEDFAKECGKFIGRNRVKEILNGNSRKQNLGEVSEIKATPKKEAKAPAPKAKAKVVEASKPEPQADPEPAPEPKPINKRKLLIDHITASGDTPEARLVALTMRIDKGEVGYNALRRVSKEVKLLLPEGGFDNMLELCRQVASAASKAKAEATTTE